MRVRLSLFPLVMTAMVCASFSPAALAQDDNIDEIVKHVKKTMAETKAWTADLSMKMNVQGMTMEWTGDVINQGEYSVSNMAIEMMGQKMTMRNIADVNGDVWMEMNMGGMINVMKSDLATAKQIEESNSDTAELPSSGGMDATKQLMDMLDASNLTYDGKETIDGVEVYLISAEVPEELKSELDQTGMMSQPGMSPDTMKMAFGVKDGFVRRYEMATENGAPFMTMAYTNLNLNPAIDESVFTYSPPPGAIVQDMAELFAGGTGSGAPGGSLALGSPAPDFTGTNLNGDAINLSDFSGKVVLVDFWATWCAPCVRELPNVIEAYKAYHDKGFEIVAISLDESKEDLETFLNEHPDMTWVHLFDGKGWDSDIAMQYQVEGIPFTLLLDRQGNIVRQDLKGEALENALADLLSD